MSCARTWLALLLGAFQCAGNAVAQQPFDLDTTFRAQFNDWYVSSILPIGSGDVIISGRIKFAGDEDFRSGALLNTDGSRDLGFADVTYMGGKLTPWDDRLYAQNAIGVRRLFIDGSLDVAFNLVNAPYFMALQGGDYHVYPDGPILMSGVHQLNYPAGGYVGFYNLIWFTASGYLDTTKTHRSGDGVIYRFKELPDGKFICTGPMSVFDGHPTSNIFRVHADGSLDTTFYTGVNWGQAFAYLPMPDGKCLTAGLFMIEGNADTLQLVRFMANGSLDPSFNNTMRFGIAPPVTGAFDLGVPNSITQLDEARLIIAGTFRDIDGVTRGSLCVIDSSGNLLNDFFDTGGCGPHTYQGYTDAGVQDIMFTADSMCYIWGEYHGYDDGTTNDLGQRFVTRLYGPDFHTALSEQGNASAVVQVYPNPSNGTVTLQLERLPRDATLVVRDALGREEQRRKVTDHYTTLDLHRASSGVYLLELWDAQGRIDT